MKEFFIPSLFPSKEDFNPELFKSKCLNNGLEESISKGMSVGLAETNEAFSNGSYSLKLHGLFLHEKIFDCIQTASCEYMPNQNIEFVTSVEGNKKCYIKYNDYVLILKREGVSFKDTGPNGVIKNQNAESHVITISYSLDFLRENIQSIYLQYNIGNNTTWTYKIPVEANLSNVDDLPETLEKEHIKPKLKSGIKKNTKHE